jgi:hypothetical protein
MSIVCNICENFNISKLVCSCKNNKENDNIIHSDEVEFSLLHSEKRKFDDLIPSNDNYLFFKINKDETIISASGDAFIEMPLTEEEILNIKLKNIKVYTIFFQDYVRPLFLNSIEKGEAYQFQFKTNITDKKLICSIYPCSMPGTISSCDIVIRYNHGTIERGRLSEFAIKPEGGGEKVEILH